MFGTINCKKPFIYSKLNICLLEIKRKDSKVIEKYCYCGFIFNVG